MKLTSLLLKFPELKLRSYPSEKNPNSIEIEYIQSDSRKTNENDIFCVADSIGSKKKEFISNTKASLILLRTDSNVVNDSLEVMNSSKVFWNVKRIPNSYKAKSLLFF